MTETELQRLKSLPVPPPADAARATALTAALAAYDAAGTSSAAADKIVRLGPRRRRWSRSPLLALAASLALAVVSLPMALRYLQQSDGRAPHLAVTEEQRPAAPAAAPVDAVAKAPAAAAPTAGDAASPGDPKPAAVAARGDVEPAPQAAPKQVAAAPAPPPAAPAAPGQSSSGFADAMTAKSRPSTGSDAHKTESGALARRRALSELPSTGPILAAPRVVQGQGGGQSANRSALLVPNEGAAPPAPPRNRDRFEAIDANPIRRVAEHPVSTFSIDVDTASYSFVRRALNAGRLPQPDAVRIEEMINYFAYDYPRPATREEPFRPTVTVVPSPWRPGNQLVHIAIKGYALSQAERPRANLVLLVDTSGSMAAPDRLPLLRNAFRMLVETLGPNDTVAIVTYAGKAQVTLEPTRIAERARILAAIDLLEAGGSTNGGEGLQRAYALAEAGFDATAVNRIILGTDGDFNVGIVDRRELKGFIERKRATGIYLSILGVGIGNHNDRLMQVLAQSGNGVAAYIDTLAEARRVLVEEASSTLFPIANDVKIQIEFNPATVAEYRLIGYETRLLKREDFANDAVDAGDVGSGHAVTAIYEITPAGGATAVAPLRYQSRGAGAPAAGNAGASRVGELAFLKLRYKRPGEPSSRLIETAIGPNQVVETITAASSEVRFGVAVAAFGQLLRGLPYLGAFGYDDVSALAAGARGDDPYGYRSEFLSLVRLAKSARP